MLRALGACLSTYTERWQHCYVYVNEQKQGMPGTGSNEEARRFHRGSGENNTRRRTSGDSSQ